MKKNIIITEIEKEKILNLYGLSNNPILLKEENLADKIKSALNSDFKRVIKETVNLVFNTPTLTNIPITYKPYFDLIESVNLSWKGNINGSIGRVRLIDISAGQPPNTLSVEVSVSVVLTSAKVKLYYEGYKSDYSWIPNIGPKSSDELQLATQPLNILGSATIGIRVRDDNNNYIFDMAKYPSIKFSTVKKQVGDFKIYSTPEGKIMVNLGTFWGFETPSFELWSFEGEVKSLFNNISQYSIWIPKIDVDMAMKGKLKTTNFNQYLYTTAPASVKDAISNWTNTKTARPVNPKEGPYVNQNKVLPK